MSGGERKVFTSAEVSQHNHSQDCWLVIHDKVYNVTKFLEDHPGGEEVLLYSAGKDASNDFDDIGHSTSAVDLMGRFYVGDIDTRMGGQRKVFTLAEVSQHNHSKDCWLVIHGKVYNVTKFLEDHHGGEEVLLSSVGKDASNDFNDIGHSDSARGMLDEFYVGDIDTSTIPTKNKLVMALQDDELHFKSFVPFFTPTPTSDPISSHNFVHSKSQTQSSYSNLQPLGSKSNSSSNSMSVTEESPDLFLKALKDDELSFNSKTLKELSKVLQDDNINKIGLYGQGESGKTTLVEAVRDKAKSLKIFDVVLFATVSQNPNIRSIQEQIASLLNLKFDKENKSRRAMKIESTLERVERILVILDDVPAEFDPEDIGIPCNDQQCKFLLTTRSRQDCSLMISEKVTHCQKMIPMRHLPKEAAWKLIQKHLSIEEEEEEEEEDDDDDDDDESSSNLLTVAKEIAFKYKWLPGTIKKIGSSFRGDLEKWKGLLASLRHASARYQIFLSFRGRDTRKNFTSTLNDELKKNGFKTFMDDDQLRTGDSISTELIQAIEDSRLSIAIFSENYPESSWCLEELVHILQCKESKKQLVWPIFYEVEPRNIGRHQTKDGENTMAKLEKKFKDDPDKINKWKSALAQVSKISGRNYIEEAVGFSQPKFIREIINSAKEYRNNYLYIRNMDMD